MTYFSIIYIYIYISELKVFPEGVLSGRRLCPEGICPDGFLSEGGFVRSFLSREVFCPRGLCLWGLCPVTQSNHELVFFHAFR